MASGALPDPLGGLTAGGPAAGRGRGVGVLVRLDLAQHHGLVGGVRIHGAQGDRLVVAPGPHRGQDGRLRGIGDACGRLAGEGAGAWAGASARGRPLGVPSGRLGRVCGP
ncbi:hypothetical protein [Streptomyces malaysiensis]|uniref:hypothetical protein n=1 Tax=Streptomyces malaysiensis TaxID=92644 RepID=UPI003CCD1785